MARFFMHKPPLTFARFVDLPENRSALLAIREVAAHLASTNSASASNNPLLLYGPPGTGKTHLVSALLHDVARQRPEITGVHLSAGDFAVNSAFADDVEGESPASGELDLFAACKDADLLIVEDLQHLPGTAAERFAQLIDDLQAQGQQMIFTAHAGPQQLQHRHGKFPARLVNRLTGGMVVRLESPGIDSRRLLLRVSAGETSIPDDIIDWLAGHLTEGGRQLVGAIAQVQMLMRTHATVDVNMVARQFATQAELSEITVEKIAERVSGYFQVQPKELVSKRRYRHLMTARHISMYLARQLTSLSLEQIGAYFGGRDHSSVLHACRKVEQALDSDTELSGAVRELQTKFC